MHQNDNKDLLLLDFDGMEYLEKKDDPEKFHLTHTTVFQVQL